MDSFYQYMPIKYLESLHENGLYFKIASLNEDKKEGDIPIKYISVLDEDIQNQSKYYTDNFTEKDIERTKGIINSVIEYTKDTILINCWHLNTTISKRMWEHYTHEDGFYIKTNSISLFESIPTHLLEIFEYTNGGILHKIDYNDYNKMPEENIKSIILDQTQHTIKNKKYIDESEYRLIINAHTLNIRCGIKLKNIPEIIDGNRDMRINLNDNDIKIDQDESIYIKVCVTKLINEIGVIGSEYICKIKSLYPTVSIQEYDKEFNKIKMH